MAQKQTKHRPLDFRIVYLPINQAWLVLAGSIRLAGPIPWAEAKEWAADHGFERPTRKPATGTAWLVAA